MKIYNNLGDNNNQFVARTTETNKDGIHLIITKSQLTSNNGSWEINYNISNDNNGHFKTLPVTIKRNAYGRQLGSFQTIGSVGTIDDFPMTFIRAPYITEASMDVSVLSTVDSKIVGVQYKNQIGLAFHPEVTDDLRIHKFFLETVKKYKEQG